MIIRRSTGKPILIEQNEDCCNVSDLMRLPEYDYQAFPYVLARSKHHISLVNVKTKHVYHLIDELKPNFDNEFTAVTPNGTIEEGGTFEIIYSSAKQDSGSDAIKVMTMKN